MNEYKVEDDVRKAKQKTPVWSLNQGPKSWAVVWQTTQPLPVLLKWVFLARQRIHRAQPKKTVSGSQDSLSLGLQSTIVALDEIHGSAHMLLKVTSEHHNYLVFTSGVLQAKTMWTTIPFKAQITIPRPLANLSQPREQEPDHHRQFLTSFFFLFKQGNVGKRQPGRLKCNTFMVLLMNCIMSGHINEDYVKFHISRSNHFSEHTHTHKWITDCLWTAGIWWSGKDCIHPRNQFDFSKFICIVEWDWINNWKKIDHKKLHMLGVFLLF